MKFDRNDSISILEDAISWVVVFGMFIYGGGKILQFDGASQLDKPVSELTGMQLMWAFYGYSKVYALTLGFFEILGGLLLLIKRTRLIGCFLISAILVNVILQDIYFGVHLGALKAAILYQSLIVIVLWLNREKLIRSVKVLLEPIITDRSRIKFIVKLVITFAVFVLLRILEYYITITW